MKTLIITHRDLDGITSAMGFAINDLEKATPGKPTTFSSIFKNFTIVDFNYGEDIYKLLENKKVNLSKFDRLVITDLTLSIKIMKDLHNQFKENLIWIDHHRLTYETTEAELIKEDIKINGIRDYSVAASILVYRYFNKEPTELAKYVGDMDIWTWVIPNSRLFIAGLMSFETNFRPDHFKFIHKLIENKRFEKEKNKIIKRGEIIIDYQKKLIKDECNIGKIVNFEGYKAFILNTFEAPGLVSDYIWSEDKYKDIEIVIVWKRLHAIGIDSVSLRSRTTSNVGVAEIARKHGGGGHLKAASFKIADISNLNL